MGDSRPRRAPSDGLMLWCERWLVEQRYRAGRALVTRETGHVVVLVRLAVVLGLMLIGVALVAHFRQSATPTPSASQSSAAASAPPETALPAPPTDPALSDPRRLGAIFQRGITAIETSNDDEAKREGARLVKAAAVLGYQPARFLIARDFPRSQLIRSVVASSEAVRYSLDPLFIPGPQSESNRAFLALMASYFSGRHELEAYATDLLSALRDDRRLQTEDRLQSLLTQLMRVPGACTALARAVVKARFATGPECSSKLQLQLENFFRVAPQQ
jgi:hypothetical protein